MRSPAGCCAHGSCKKTLFAGGGPTLGLPSPVRGLISGKEAAWALYIVQVLFKHSSLFRTTFSINHVLVRCRVTLCHTYIILPKVTL